MTKLRSYLTLPGLKIALAIAMVLVAAGSYTQLSAFCIIGYPDGQSACSADQDTTCFLACNAQDQYSGGCVASYDGCNSYSLECDCF